VTATATVRTTILGVYVHDGTDWQYDGSAYAASCSFGFDQRVAEATVRRTGGGGVAVNYWSKIEIRMGCAPGAGEAVRFNGYVVPVDNQLFPIDATLVCKGNLYRAQWVRNQQPDGTDLAGPAGTSDQAQVMAVLDYCGVPYTAGNIAGTGKALGSVYNGDPADVFTAGPWWWAEGEPGLSCIERVDEVSVPDAATGRYRTFETLGGDVFRIPMATAPHTTPDFSFAEGVDVLEARITRDPAGAANRVVVTGGPTDITGGVVGVEDLDVYRFTAAAPSGSAPYLPPGLPNGPDGYPQVTASFGSPMLEKALITDPLVSEDVLSCQAVATFLLAEYNCVLDTLELATPRDDLLGPGQTIHLHSPRLGITDPDQHYWLQRLEITLDERGAFTQRLTCLRRS